MPSAYQKEFTDLLTDLADEFPNHNNQLYNGKERRDAIKRYAVLWYGWCHFSLVNKANEHQNTKTN